MELNRRSPDASRAFVLETFVRGLAGQEPLPGVTGVPESIRQAAEQALLLADAAYDMAKRGQ